MKYYHFSDATSLLDFIEPHRAQLIGKRICRYYSDEVFHGYPYEPVVFDFGDCSLILSYFEASDLTLFIAEPGAAAKDPTLHCFFPEDDCFVWPHDAPFVRQVIRDVTVSRFSHGCLVNGATGKRLPPGGDYFCRITVHLENGSTFILSPADADAPGRMEILSADARRLPSEIPPKE